MGTCCSYNGEVYILLNYFLDRRGKKPQSSKLRIQSFRIK